MTSARLILRLLALSFPTLSQAQTVLPVGVFPADDSLVCKNTQPYGPEYLTQAKSCLKAICGDTVTPEQSPELNNSEFQGKVRLYFRELVETNLEAAKKLGDLSLTSEFETELTRLDAPSLVINDSQRVIGDMSPVILTYQQMQAFLEESFAVTAMLPERLPYRALSKMALRARASTHRTLLEMFGDQGSEEAIKYIDAVQFIVHADRRSAQKDLSDGVDLLIASNRQARLFGLNREELKGRQEQISRLVGALAPSNLPGLDMFQGTKIMLSSRTLMAPHGLGFAAHEMAHAIAPNLLYSYSDETIEKIMVQYRKIRDVHPSGTTRYVEEDWADFFSAKAVPENLACEAFTLKDSTVISHFQPSDLNVTRWDLHSQPEFNHSSDFYRLLFIHKNQGHTLPQPCEETVRIRREQTCQPRQAKETP